MGIVISVVRQGSKLTLLLVSFNITEGEVGGSGGLQNIPGISHF